MGAKSTITISRDEAEAKILQMLPHLSDTAVADLLETVNDELYANHDWDNCLGLHNFWIGSDPS